MIGTWFEPDQPSGARLTWAVSGISDASSGPSARSLASTSVRKRSFASSHCLVLSRVGHFRMAGSMSGSRLDRAECSVEFEQQPVDLDSLLQLAGLIRPADARPQHRVLARCDRGGRVDLDVAELLGDLDDVARPLRVEQLRTHDDAACLVARELMRHGVESRALASRSCGKCVCPESLRTSECRAGGRSRPTDGSG